MKYVVAVSGGIDSVVLLDMLATKKLVIQPGQASTRDDELTVAHFDHGIRDDSAHDARFVKGVAESYGLPFVGRREELGAGASEETARRARYTFLRQVAVDTNALIVTAHHADDAVETVAINLTRGTGWRGLAVLDTPMIARPLLGFSKQQLRNYALTQRLEWVEDSTNGTDAYLRNRLRRRIQRQLGRADAEALRQLRNAQVTVKQAIEPELRRFCTPPHYSRYLLTMCDPQVGTEILRTQIMALGGPSPTRPQLDRALLAIKTARPATTYQLGGGVNLVVSERTYSMKTTQ